MGQNIRVVRRVVGTLAIGTFLFAIYAGAQEQTRQSRAELEDRIARVESVNLSEEIASMETEDAIEFLSTLIRRRARKEEDSLATEAIKLIGRIPGHAERYAKKIEEARGKKGYDRYRAKAFSQLGFFASDEAIKVLGQYLDDEADAPTDDENINATSGANLGSNAVFAIMALERLDLEGVPKQKGPGRRFTKEYREAWRKWWSEVGVARYAPDEEPHPLPPSEPEPPKQDSAPTTSQEPRAEGSEPTPFLPVSDPLNRSPNNPTSKANS